MKKLVKYFLQGLLFLLPIMLTIFIISKILLAWDETAGKIFPFDIPGLPLLISIFVIIFIGYMGSWWFSVKLLNIVDYIFKKVPIVQFIYGIIKDTLASLFGEKKAFNKVAVIRIPETDMKLLGFVTSEDLSDIGFQDHVAVYVMQSMQWAGNTVLVPKEDVEILQGVKMEDIMKFIVSAGAVSSSDKNVAVSV